MLKQLEKILILQLESIGIQDFYIQGFFNFEIYIEFLI